MQLISYDNKYLLDEMGHLTLSLIDIYYNCERIHSNYDPYYLMEKRGLSEIASYINGNNSSMTDSINYSKYPYSLVLLTRDRDLSLSDYMTPKCYDGNYTIRRVEQVRYFVRKKLWQRKDFLLDERNKGEYQE